MPSWQKKGVPSAARFPKKRTAWSRHSPTKDSIVIVGLSLRSLCFDALTVKGCHFTGLGDNASSVKTGDSSLSGMVYRPDCMHSIFNKVFCHNEASALNI